MAKLQLNFVQADPTAKADISAVSANAYKPWSSLNDLLYDNVSPPGNYATLEHNFAILDGTMEEFPDDTSGQAWGLWSDSVSGDDGAFSVPPMLDISFSTPHKSRGLTLYFYPHTDDYADRVRVTWYGDSDAVITSGEYTLTSVVGVVMESVEGFRRITVEFLSTNIRGRFVKLFALDYGIVRVIRDEEISGCKILEEVDPTVESVSINTLNANIRTRDGIFSPVTSADPDDMMMRRQMLTVTRDGAPFGTFFLETWEDIYQSGIEFDIYAIDAMGVLDLYGFMGGLYTNKPVTELLDEILAVAFPTRLVSYILDPELLASTVTGWIPICSCGEALQHICFALNAAADTARIGNIWIYPRETEITYSVPLDRQYRRGRDSPSEFVSGVDVVSHSYVQGTEAATAQNGVLPVGQAIIEFQAPLHSLTATGATILRSGANYAVLDVAVSGVVVLSGRRYSDNQLLHSVRAELSAGEVESVMVYENYTLISPGTGQWLAQRLFDYLRQLIVSELDVALDDLEVGYKARLATRGRDIVGTITRLDITSLLSGTATMEVRGNVD